MTRLQESRRRRYWLRTQLREFSLSRRQRDCGTDIVGEPAIFIRPRAHDANESLWTAGLRNISMCSRLTCPTCSPVAWSITATELSAGAIAWQNNGGEIAYVTLRLAPGGRPSLVDRVNALRSGWAAAQGTTSVVQRRRMDFLGKVATHWRVEVEHAFAHGWDPHLRVLIFLEGTALDRRSVEHRLAEAIWPTWLSGVEKAGLKAPSRRSGIGVELLGPGPEAVRHVITRYVSSIDTYSRVQVRHQRRSMWDVLSVACRGDRSSQLDWMTLEEAFMGRTMRRGSPGLRDLLGIVSERPPHVSVDERVLATLSRADWVIIEPAVCSLLEAVENADMRKNELPERALHDWLSTAGISAPVRQRRSKKRRKR